MLCLNGFELYSCWVPLLGVVKFPKFQTGIFVEWKAPLVSLVCHRYVIGRVDLTHVPMW